MQSPLCKSQSLNACFICKAPSKYVPKPPAPFIGHATPSNTPGMSSEVLAFGRIKHRRAPAPAPTQSVLATQLPTAKKAAQAKNEPMATICENSTTVEGFPKVQPPVLQREGPAKAPWLDQPREDAYAKHAPTSPRAEILDIEE